MNKLIPYGIAVLGLIGIIISGEKIHPNLPILNLLPRSAVLIAGVILVGIGVILMMSKKGGKSRQIEKEVPIYKGKKIVGYRVED